MNAQKRFCGEQGPRCVEGLSERAMHLFAKKLVAGGFLRQEDTEDLISLCGPPRFVPAGANFFPREHHAENATVILSGVACRYKMIADGRRQIVALLFPGDITGLCDGV